MGQSQLGIQFSRFSLFLLLCAIAGISPHTGAIGAPPANKGGTKSGATSQAAPTPAFQSIPFQTQALDGEPSLRLEGGAHTSDVLQLAAPIHQKWIATASRDRSVRIWDPLTGKLLQILRVPGGSNSLLTSTALAPDGQTVAVMMAETQATYTKNTLYLFHRETGVLTHRVVFKDSSTVQPEQLTPVGQAPVALTPFRLPCSQVEVQRLAFSPDGKILLLGGHGRVNTQERSSLVISLRLPDFGDPRIVTLDRQFISASGLTSAPEIGDIAFTPLGTVLVADSKGQVRQFSRTLSVLSQAKLSDKAITARMALSPDGSRLAVALQDRPEVALFETTGLTLKATLKAPLRAGLVGKNLKVSPAFMSVAWSPDGNSLFAAGTVRTLQGFSVIKWSVPGIPMGQEWATTEGPVSDLLGLKDGALLLSGSSAPRWERFGSDAKRTLQITAPVARFAGNLQAVRVDNTGTKVEAALEGSPSRTLSFSLADRMVNVLEGREGSEKRGQKILQNALEGQKIEYNATLRRVELARGWWYLWPSESLNAWTFGGGGAVSYAGTNQRLVRFRLGAGSPDWGIPLPSEPCSVTLALAEQLVVVALSDGTIRWYRAEDGQELLALLLHADGKRWILWTPTGHYDASPGSEDLIGWLASYQAVVAPDFFPVSRFRDRFYSPGGLADVLTSLDPTAARPLNAAAPPASPVATAPAANNKKGTAKGSSSVLGKALPPTVTLLNSGDALKGNQLELETLLRSPSGAPILELRPLLDGRPLPLTSMKVLGGPITSAQAALFVDGVARRVILPRPDRPGVVSLMARSEVGWSEPASFYFGGGETTPPPLGLATSAGPSVAVPENTGASTDSSGTSPATSGAPSGPPKLYLLAIGVSKYQQSSLTLQYPAKDATDFVGLMKLQDKKLYDAVEVRLLTDAQATQQAVIQGLKWLEQKTTRNDVAVIFMAGHGMNDVKGDYYFMPQDVDPTKITTSGVSRATLAATFSSLPGKVLFFLDTCHAGNVFAVSSRGGTLAQESNGFMNELIAAENGVIVFAASTGTQVSLESPQWNNGAFTLALVEGLKGQADGKDTGRVTVNMMDLYLSERVRQLTQGSQTPTSVRPSIMRDFPVAVTK